MKLSPVQLLESKFLKIEVEGNPSAAEADLRQGVELDIEHMTHIERHERPDTEQLSDVRKYLIALGIRSGKDATNIPFKFEVVASAIISVDPAQFNPDNNADDSATKFGFSILFGQIREMVGTVTGRMHGGPFMLPTMSFMDSTFPIKKASKAK